MAPNKAGAGPLTRVGVHIAPCRHPGILSGTAVAGFITPKGTHLFSRDTVKIDASPLIPMQSGSYESQSSFSCNQIGSAFLAMILDRQAVD